MNALLASWLCDPYFIFHIGNTLTYKHFTEDYKKFQLRQGVYPACMTTIWTLEMLEFWVWLTSVTAIVMEMASLIGSNMLM